MVGHLLCHVDDHSRLGRLVLGDARILEDTLAQFAADHHEVVDVEVAAFAVVGECENLRNVKVA